MAGGALIKGHKIQQDRCFTDFMFCLFCSVSLALFCFRRGLRGPGPSLRSLFTVWGQTAQSKPDPFSSVLFSTSLNYNIPSLWTPFKFSFPSSCTATTWVQEGSNRRQGSKNDKRGNQQRGPSLPSVLLPWTPHRFPRTSDPSHKLKGGQLECAGCAEYLPTPEARHAVGTQETPSQDVSIPSATQAGVISNYRNENMEASDWVAVLLLTY